jgi:hypothetical protein
VLSTDQPSTISLVSLTYQWGYFFLFSPDAPFLSLPTCREYPGSSFPTFCGVHWAPFPLSNLSFSLQLRTQPTSDTKRHVPRISVPVSIPVSIHAICAIHATTVPQPTVCPALLTNSTASRTGECRSLCWKHTTVCVCVCPPSPSLATGVFCNRTIGKSEVHRMFETCGRIENVFMKGKFCFVVRRAFSFVATQCAGLHSIRRRFQGRSNVKW